jgi:hypothetical protein
LPADRVADDVIRIALDKAEGIPFERFANAFYGSLVGVSFVPLGGLRDGGANARDGTIFEDGSRVQTFYQASVEEDAEGKIRRTVRRLRDFGRAPRNLIYLTSRTVKYSDRVERALSDELDVTVTIRDGNYIALHVNERLVPVKRYPRLARNDALMALAVCGFRRHGGEMSRVTEFGWGSWWLTGESTIMKFTRDIVREHKAPYSMRPISCSTSSRWRRAPGRRGWRSRPSSRACSGSGWRAGCPRSSSTRSWTRWPRPKAWTTRGGRSRSASS